MFVFTGGFALGKSKLLDKGITFIWSQIQSEDGKRDKGEKQKMLPTQVDLTLTVKKHQTLKSLTQILKTIKIRMLQLMI